VGRTSKKRWNSIADEKKVITELGLEFTSPDTAAKLAADQSKQDAEGNQDGEKPKDKKKMHS
jgi:hypothetical protein